MELCAQLYVFVLALHVGLVLSLITFIKCVTSDVGEVLTWTRQCNCF